MRLTNLFRSKIATRAIEAAYAKRAAELLDREYRVAWDVYRVFVSAEVEMRVKRLPKGWVRYGDVVRFHAADGRFLHLKIRAEHPMADQTRWQLRDVGSPVSIDVDRLLRDEEKLRADKAETRLKLETLLESYTTDNALREAWPEGRPFIDAAMAPPSAPKVLAPDFSFFRGLIDG